MLLEHKPNQKYHGKANELDRDNVLKNLYVKLRNMDMVTHANF